MPGKPFEINMCLLKKNGFNVFLIADAKRRLNEI